MLVHPTFRTDLLVCQFFVCGVLCIVSILCALYAAHCVNSLCVVCCALCQFFVRCVLCIVSILCALCDEMQEELHVAMLEDGLSPAQVCCVCPGVSGGGGEGGGDFSCNNVSSGNIAV